MGLSLETSISALTVFVQGLLSFFSPCVLPIIPLYMGYLAGGTARLTEDGSVEYPRKRVFINTLAFVVGVSFAFFVLGFAFTEAGKLLSSNQRIFATVSGVIMVLFGLYMLGVFGKERLIETEHRLPFNLGSVAMNPAVALVLGFTFSFAWTPCVGPVLGSVLLMASTSSSATIGYMLIGVYTLGFILPFLAVGLFTGEVLRFFKKHGSVVKNTVKVGGVLLVLMGVMTITGWMNGVSSYLSTFSGASPSAVEESTTEQGTQDGGEAASQNASRKDLTPAPLDDFELKDQSSTTHKLSDYQGKVVFLNFFATWCGPCQQEIPAIEALYKERGENAQDVVVLGVANPKTFSNQSNADVTEEEVKAFIKKQGITYPVLMDTTGEFFSAYGVRAFPTTFMITKEGEVYGMVSGSLSADKIKSIVEQTERGF